MINPSPEPIGNRTASLGEDLAVIGPVGRRALPSGVFCPVACLSSADDLAAAENLAQYQESLCLYHGYVSKKERTTIIAHKSDSDRAP
jgi:hypothetical protein